MHAMDTENAQGPDRLRAELRRYGKELAPGAVEDLVALWGAELDGLSPDRLVEEIAARLEIPGNAGRYVRWDGRETDTVVVSPVRRVLHRYEAELKPGAVVSLGRRWSVELNGWPLPRIAGEVVRRLAAPEYASYRRDHACPEDAVRRVLARFADDLIPEALDVLTQRWATELLRSPDEHLIEEGVALRLAQPANAVYLKLGRAMATTAEARSAPAWPGTPTSCGPGFRTSCIVPGCLWWVISRRGKSPAWSRGCCTSRDGPRTCAARGRVDPKSVYETVFSM